MHRSFHILAVLATASVAACTVAPGPAEQQATQASIACQQGYSEACQSAAYLQTAAASERAHAQHNANVDAVLAAGLVGVAVSTDIVGASAPGYYGRTSYGRGSYRG
jgi:hypothetical protein